ncbi:YhdP family protein [Oceanococcus atlanticus]|uniref:YhdP family protein n=1 Tax=Oceanococcus atlanticus TaxID=1317117 RepID=UPI0009FB3266|nr:YhdP family protein [Oceanococcus atlanticus]
MNRLRRRLWVTGVGFAATILILLGLLVGAFRIGVQLVPEYRAEVQARVAEVLKSPVDIQGMDLIWRGRYPTLQLNGVEIGDDPQARLSFDQLNLGFSLFRLAAGDVIPARISLVGTRLQLSYEDGRLHLAGVESDGSTQAAPGDFLEQLRRVGEVQLFDARVRWIDIDNARPIRDLQVQRISAVRRFGRVQVLGDLHLGGQPDTRLEAELLLDPEPWQLRRVELDARNWQIWEDIQAFFPQAPALAGQPRQLVLDSHWRDGVWQQASLEFDFVNLRPAAVPRGFIELAGELQLSRPGESYGSGRDAHGVRASMQLDRVIGPSGRWPQQHVLAEWSPGASGFSTSRYALNAQYLRLDDLSPWLTLLPQAVSAHLTAMAPSGELHDVVLRSSPGETIPELTAEFQQLSVRPVDKIPGMYNLSGAVSLGASGGRVQLTSQDLVVEAPRVFDQPLMLDTLSGTARWQRGPDGWRIEAPALHYAGMNMDGVGRLDLLLGEQPRIDLDLNFFCSDPRPWLAYQPTVWHDSLKSWLNRAIGPAQVAAGQVAIRGPLQGIPYPQGEGTFRVDLDLRDTTFNFAPDWPALDVQSARLLIDGKQLSVDLAAGGISNASVQQARAIIPDLRDSVLSVDAAVQGDAADIWAMLGRSGLRKNMREAFDSLDLSGRTQGQLKLTLPLKDKNAVDYAVDLELDRAALWTKYWPDPVQKISGALHIDRNGLRGRDISAVVAGLPAQVNLMPDQGKTRIEARFSAEPKTLPPSVPVPQWLKARGAGASDWRLEMEVGRGADRAVIVRSPLLGTALDLPQPFAKSAEQARPLTVRIEPDENTRVHVTYGERLGLDLLLDKQGQGLRAARLNLGADAMPAGAPGWWVEGRLAEVNLDQWLPLIQELTRSASGSGATQEFGGLVLRADTLFAFGQRLPDTRIQVTRESAAWAIGVAGSRAQGRIEIPHQQPEGRLRLRGDFQRLNWTREVNLRGGDQIDPNEIPHLNLEVEDFALNDVALGRMQLDLEPVGRGTRITRFIVDSPKRRELDVSGLWLRDDTGTSGAVEFAMDTEAFASWLTVFGYEDHLVARRGRLNGQLNWSPDPQGLSVGNASGRLDFDFSDGQLLNIEPGAGRVLGLFSINALPRRFFLDFSDVVNTGLSFDELSGGFDISGGVATTQNLQLKGTSVRVAVRGDVDLVQRRYDQVVTIYPGVSSGVSLAATVLGGPVVGLFTLLAQELLDQPLDQVTQIGYHLGGSWDNPQVSRLQ